MKVNFKQVLKNPNGSPIIEGADKKEVTLLNVSQTALLNGDKLTATQKYEAYKLSMKVEQDDVDLTVEEVKKIKDAIGEIFGVWVTGVAWDALEGKE